MDYFGLAKDICYGKAVQDHEDDGKYRAEKELENRKMTAIINREKSLISIYDDMGNHIDAYQCEEIIVK